MKATIVQKVEIGNGKRTEFFAVATSERTGHSVRWSLTFEAHLTEWTNDREAAEELKQQIEGGLPAFKVTRDDGNSYVTSMAIGTTLESARKYFIGALFTDEDCETGKEHHWTAIAVEAA